MDERVSRLLREKIGKLSIDSIDRHRLRQIGISGLGASLFTGQKKRRTCFPRHPNCRELRRASKIQVHKPIYVLKRDDPIVTSIRNLVAFPVELRHRLAVRSNDRKPHISSNQLLDSPYTHRLAIVAENRLSNAKVALHAALNQGNQRDEK